MAGYEKAIVGGLIGMVIGALLFFGVAYASGHMISYVAIASGAIVGALTGFLGKSAPKDTVLGIIGAVFGILAILLAYFLLYMAPITFEGITIQASALVSFGEFLGLLEFGVIDVLFLLMSGAAGYGVALRVKEMASKK